MRFNHRICVLVFVCCCLLQNRAMAASAYLVDEANVLAPNTFQNENWLSHTSKNETVAVVNAAYRIGDAEVTLQETHDVLDDNQSDTITPQIKYQWRGGDDQGRIASAIVLGANYATEGTHFAGLYAYVPASLTVAQVVDINVNLGTQYVNPDEQYFVTWGVGSEYHATPYLSMVGEVFGRNTDSPAYQLGPRAVIFDAVQVDAIYGHNVFNTSEDVLTLGVTFSL